MEYTPQEFEQRWKDDVVLQVGVCRFFQIQIQNNCFSQEYSPGLGLGLFSVGKRNAPKPDAFVRKYREDRPTYMTNHADAAMRSLG